MSVASATHVSVVRERCRAVFSDFATQRASRVVFISGEITAKVMDRCGRW